ncbi:hypothetical protein SteCoe_22220 [Stentor coeruleus]|uniref:Uncharacterized protein n=1 Tax=Stentor coeruleus TaxID=5963 RepID=A0A1R2BMX6_9CILI|nr:hypothetical protein SteCoe_22220 [Stentor coeruleus]
MEQRWKCRELNPYDLMPERELINVFITSPKLTDVSSMYKTFKSQKTKSRKKILYKYSPPPVKDCKVIKHRRPRFANDLPEPAALAVLRKSTSPKPISKSPTQEAEEFFEDLIRNRKNLILPMIERPVTPCSNLKEKFIKSKCEMSQDRDSKCETLLQKIKYDIRNNNNNSIESEITYAQKQPIRKWDSRSDRVTVQIRFKSQAKPIVKQTIDYADDEYNKKIENIGVMLESCKEEILKWNS